ncbi:metallopeptidase TldD-related protein [Niabella yanshanensis]|uniref:Metallopeptidase TldD-related protein n=1 Tax=Niabella yanshanensis TaxID=577386 RepID=A0ABZ0W4T8_9BACT|nr:metallopeptidase TldD-related protein [Niabella yanshanensis]WQD37729.1 metallopeptidase TldD-related protein [Niabella yanshanensis]
MRIRIFFLVLILGFTGFVVKAQDLKDNFYVKVLNDELQRNIQRLHLPDLEKPFYIAYNLQNVNSYHLSSERGEITTVVKTPVNNKSVSVKLRVGDYHRNFDYMMYDGYFANLPDEASADEYRRLLWLETDRAYKNNARQFSGFMSSLKRVSVDEKELALDDLARITPVVKDFGAIQPIQLDTKKWEQQLKVLSALFIAYPKITTSYCRLLVNSSENYIVSSEGSVIRKPGGAVTFMAYGATSDEEGNNYNSNYSITVKSMEELPAWDQLHTKVKELISKIQQKELAKAFEGSYMGPVLFMGNAVTDIVNQCFSNTLQTRRKPIIGYNSGGTSYEEKLGQKLVASDLTVTAIPSLKMVNGKHTTGHYEIDDEGVVPADSLVLIEAGILKSLLNGRTPTRKFLKSQGFAQSFMGRNYNAGVLRLTSSKIASADSMQVRLLRLAKEEGLTAAYMVKDMSSNSPEIYKIDVATGKTEMVNECRITPLAMKSLRRFILASDKQQLENSSDYSIISPESLIVNEIEIEQSETTTKPKPIIVSNPLLDKSAAGTRGKTTGKIKKAVKK